ncbi:hypothetical protein [Isoptericola sp. BMS4]|uniref:hypothetical protein n=1 Tax=Isoptericola sp. BMS4 TaxID=2527875 RepID=UPI0014237545|nr:hypothetical protein [Isoptericola sp. BMS4]
MTTPTTSTTPPTTPSVPPSDPYAAADWLLARHEWPRDLVARVVLPDEGPHWLDQLVDAHADLATFTAAWARYEDTHREPGTRATDAEWDAWEAAGPRPAPAARMLMVMSSGEARMCRLLATLHPTERTAWCLGDLDGLDHRGVAFVVDWTAVALAGVAWDPAGARALAAVRAVTR